jgi:hypothetical protein
VSLFNASEAALRPPGFDPALEPGLSGAEANCLTCHQVNGFDGGKVKADLALVARAMPAAEFVKWTLEPSSVKPDTTMPALSTNLARSVLLLGLRVSCVLEVCGAFGGRVLG